MRDLKDVIAKLGEMSPNDIAAHLLEHEVKAECGSHSKCAIAVYVAKETGLQYVSVGGYITQTVGVTEIGELDPSTHRMEENPWSVQEFISRFDQGHYPELEG